MRIPTPVSASAAFALLLAAVAALLLALTPRATPPPPTVTAEAPSNNGLMPCLYHVMIIHDVHWAASCMKNDPPDNAADCTLPNERAAVLNKAQDEAESFCLRRGS